MSDPPWDPRLRLLTATFAALAACVVNVLALWLIPRDADWVPQGDVGVFWWLAAFCATMIWIGEAIVLTLPDGRPWWLTTLMAAPLGFYAVAIAGQVAAFSFEYWDTFSSQADRTRNYVLIGICLLAVAVFCATIWWIVRIGTRNRD
jgi:hypothetical protein